MNETAYVIGQFLVAEAVAEGKASDEWSGIVDTFVPQLLKVRRMELLSAPTRLAVAISIVGSGRIDLYTIAFRLLCDWEYVGGPFWIVQEEILRFATIHQFKCEIDKNNSEKSVTTTNIRKKFPDILPNDLPAYITHKIVKSRIHFLRTEFEWLLDDIRRGSADKTQSILLEYTERFPLEDFIKWFLEWAQKLLVRFEALSVGSGKNSHLTVEMCRISLQGNASSAGSGSNSSSHENRLLTPGSSRAGVGRLTALLNMSNTTRVATEAVTANVTDKSNKTSKTNYTTNKTSDGTNKGNNANSDITDFQRSKKRSSASNNSHTQVRKSRKTTQGQLIHEALVNQDSRGSKQLEIFPKVMENGNVVGYQTTRTRIVEQTVRPNQNQNALRNKDDQKLKIMIPTADYQQTGTYQSAKQLYNARARPIAVTVEKYFADRAENDVGLHVRNTNSILGSIELELNSDEVENKNFQFRNNIGPSTPVPKFNDSRLHRHDANGNNTGEFETCIPSRESETEGVRGRALSPLSQDSAVSGQGDAQDNIAEKGVTNGIATGGTKGSLQEGQGEGSESSDSSGSSGHSDAVSGVSCEAHVGGEEIEFYETASDSDSSDSSGSSVGGGGIMNTLAKSVWGIFSPTM